MESVPGFSFGLHEVRVDAAAHSVDVGVANRIHVPVVFTFHGPDELPAFRLFRRAAYVFETVNSVAVVTSRGTTRRSTNSKSNSCSPLSCFSNGADPRRSENHLEHGILQSARDSSSLPVPMRSCLPAVSIGGVPVSGVKPRQSPPSTIPIFARFMTLVSMSTGRSSSWERLEGETLASRLERGPLELRPFLPLRSHLWMRWKWHTTSRSFTVISSLPTSS